MSESESPAPAAPSVPERVLSIHTDIAMIVAFDPAHLLPRVKEPRRWWDQDPLGIQVFGCHRHGEKNSIACCADLGT